jgi:hypothetical protein
VKTWIVHIGVSVERQGDGDCSSGDMTLSQVPLSEGEETKVMITRLLVVASRVNKEPRTGTARMTCPADISAGLIAR